MKSGWRRRSRAWVVSGMVATGVVLGGGAPAPGQVEGPLGPEVVYIDAFGPMVLGYEDCDGVVHTEEDLFGFVYLELDYPAESDVEVGVSFSGSLADDVVDPPAAVQVLAGEEYGEVSFTLDELETGDLTVTVEPGLGYTTSGDDTYTIEVSDEVEILGSCLDDLGDPPNDTDRQVIEVGERPVPIGFFDEDEAGDDGDDQGESTTTSAVGGPTTSEAAERAWASRARASRAVPEGYETTVVSGALPPGLTYADDEWGGAATTPGTYDFDIRLCYDQTVAAFADGRNGTLRRPAPRAFPPVICFGSVDVQVVVLEGEPPATAPPAQPVTGAARFTG